MTAKLATDEGAVTHYATDTDGLLLPYKNTSISSQLDAVNKTPGTCSDTFRGAATRGFS
jgi:hypothetical protein